MPFFASWHCSAPSAICAIHSRSLHHHHIDILTVIGKETLPVFSTTRTGSKPVGKGSFPTTRQKRVTSLLTPIYLPLSGQFWDSTWISPIMSKREFTTQMRISSKMCMSYSTFPLGNESVCQRKIRKSVGQMEY